MKYRTFFHPENRPSPPATVRAIFPLGFGIDIKTRRASCAVVIVYRVCPDLFGIPKPLIFWYSDTKKKI